MTRQQPTSRHGERGSISIWLVTTGFAMIVLVGLAVDLGGQVHAQQQARAVADHQETWQSPETLRVFRGLLDSRELR